MYKAGSQKNKIGNKVDDKSGAKGIGLGTKWCIRLGARKIKIEKAIGKKVDDKTGTKGKGLGTKMCIRLGARKIKLEIRQLETKWTISGR